MQAQFFPIPRICSDALPQNQEEQRDTMKTKIKDIAVVGGTGSLGAGIVSRLARAGYSVIIGSRDPAKAVAMAEANTDGKITGMGNRDAAAVADLVVVSVPFSNQAATLHDIKPVCEGKIVIDTTVPLVPPKVSHVKLPDEGSAAKIAANILGDGVALVTAFHNVSAVKLGKAGDVGCDILVFSDVREAVDIVVDMIGKMELRGVYGGVLANSSAAEALTSVLIQINRTYKVADGAGIRVSGI